MKFLIDGTESRVEARAAAWADGVRGQLLTPLTRYGYARGWDFGIDNGAFSRFDKAGFLRLLSRMARFRSRCLFVAAPDKVGDCAITDARWKLWGPWIAALGWPPAYVAQDGCTSIPANASALFIGGSTEWKDSEHAYRLVRLALRRNLHVHVGRVNTPVRFKVFSDLGAHTCDGSGASKYDHMWEALRRG